MQPRNWYLTFVICALIGILAGYVFTLFYQPALLPPLLRFGSLREPTNILLLGTDVVYSGQGRKLKADQGVFTGRSDTIMVARLDPYRNSFAVLSIPRDTWVRIPHHGMSKINAANAAGGPELTKETVTNLLNMPIDHHVVLNVRGLVALVDEIGGITIDIPKKMKYSDDTAKLYINLEPGVRKLTGTQAMGFVRFRHDGLGDIGRVQRQELFIRAVLDRAMQPDSWSHIPKLLEIAQNYIDSDMSYADLTGVAAFVRAVPKANQTLVMLPGDFSGTGNWAVDRADIRRMVSKITGTTFMGASRGELRLTVQNASSDKTLGRKLIAALKKKGYRRLSLKPLDGKRKEPLAVSRIIAQRGNPEDAELVRDDLDDIGDLVTASVGDIESAVTVLAGDDLIELASDSKSDTRGETKRKARAD
ncbi:MAG: LCP family protein [Candidatus Melainabacteria bacterium]|nr:LCP family protein [Candidatus Melainabacteria bacterium]